jgi:superfamily II DNA or RNA helicase
MNLRPYQVEAKTLLSRCFALGKLRVILCLPTGAGKTVTFASMAAQATAKGKRVIILTDRIELLSQAGNTLFKGGMEPQYITANNRTIIPGHLLNVAMVETFNNRIKRNSFRMALGKPDLMIIDEAHKMVFSKIISQYPDTYIVGATATPVSSNRNMPLNDLYEDIVEPVRIRELIEMGFLVNARTYGAKEEIKNLKVERGEYTDQSLMDAFDKRSMYDGVIDQYGRLCKGEKALCFNVNIAHSKHMDERMRAAGLRSGHVDGEMDEHSRKKVLKAFSDGDLDLLNNVGVLTTGYDEPSVRSIIINRKTKSLPLYFQMAGRGSRLYQNKSHFTILDMGSNFLEHGLWNEDVDWCELFRNPKKKSDTEGVRPVKQCMKCGAIVPLSASECPECGHKFQVQREGPKVITSEEFVEVSSTLPDHLQKPWEQMSVTELEEFRKFKRYTTDWVVRCLKDKAIEELARHVDAGVFKPAESGKAYQQLAKGYFEMYASIKKYRPGWVNIQIKNL